MNNGNISANASAAVNLAGGGTFTIDNRPSGTIASSVVPAIEVGAGVLNLTNEGAIQNLSGGAAINSSGVNTVRNSGTISGGGGVSGAAITFGGNADTLILEPTSVITGYVDAGAGTDTLALAGAGNGSFDLGAVGPTQQYRAIENFEKREAGTWTLTGSSSSQAQNWRVLQGTLQLASGASLQQGSAIESASDATGLVTIRISGALVGTGVGVTLSSPFNANSLILDSGATFGSRTLLQTDGATYLTGPTPFPNNVAITGGVLLVGDGGVGTGGYISGNVANDAVLGFDHSDDITYSGTISGSGFVAHQGTGTLTLVGNNTYTGGTTILAGTLQLGTVSGLTGSIAGDVTNNGTLALGHGGPWTLPGAISGTGTVTQIGFGTTTLTGDSTYTGGTTINAGTLQMGNGGATGSIVGNVTDNGTLSFNRSDASTFAGMITGTGAVNQIGAGTTTLTADNTYTGGTTISAGALQLGNGGTSGSIVGDVVDNGTLAFNRSDALTFAGTITGSGSLTQAGTGTTTLTGTGSSVGSVNVAVGTLDLAHAGAFTTTGAYTTAAGATTQIAADSSLSVGGAFTQAATSTLDVALGSAQPVISAATADLGGTLNITGFGASAPTSASALIGTQTNVIHTTGGITNDFDTVSLGGAASPVDYLTLAGGKSANALDYNVGFGLTWLAGTTAGDGVFTLTSPADTFNVDVVLANQAASVTGWDGTTLTKNGAGTLLLSAVNTYTGQTLVNAGTLQTGIANAFATSSAVNVASGAALALNSFDQIANNLSGAGSVTLGSAVLTANNTADTTFGGALSGTGGLIKNGIAALTLTGDSAYTGGTTISAGTLQLGAGGTAGSIVGDVTNNGTLSFNRSDALTYAGAITGTGAVNQIGAGTTTLTADNTYAGGTTISAGTLQLGNGGTTGSITGNVADNGTLSFNRSDALTFAGAITGTGAVNQVGAGTTTLTADSTYAGGTTISAGTLQLGTTSGLTGSIVGDVTNNGTLALGHGNAWTFGGAISGSGNVNQIGGGTTTLTADNTYTGGTTISAGTLQLGNGGTTGSITSDVTDNGTLSFNRSDTLTFAGTITGTGAVNQIGAGTTTLTGDSTYTGGTTISAGTLQLGAGGITGSIVGDVTNNGTLAFNRSNAITFAGAIGGAGAINQIGAGTTQLTGDSGTFSGTTNVTNGMLRVDGNLGGTTSTLNVSTGGILGGHGTIGGNVAIADGTLAPGASPGTLTIAGNLALSGASVLNYEFGQAGTVGGTLNDLTVVGGNLTLDGTLNVTTSAGGTFGPGLYRVINYGGTLIDNGLVVGTAPATGSFIQTSVANQVNLINTNGLTLSYWDGAAGPKNNNVVDGGTGIWQGSAGNDNWTTADGSVNAPFSDGSFAVFTATPGTVTIDNGPGAVTASGMQFASSGYVLQGDPIALVETEATVPGITTIRVGDGTGAGAGYVATINSVLSGAVQIDKTDLGTLVLSGANTYTGGTTISGGTLSVGADANLGAAAGGVALDGGTLESSASFTSGRAVTITPNNGSIQTDAGTTLTLTNTLSGASGALTKEGDGTLVLTSSNTYGGGTTISAGTLQIGTTTGLTGSIVGDIANNGTLALGHGNAWTFTGAISGTGNVNQIGLATTTLTADNTYTGGTTISAGALQLGNGGTSGSIVGDVVDNGTLAFNRSDALTFAGTITGSGSLTQAGTGTTTLTGTGSSVGSVNVAVGTLDLAHAGAFTTTGAYTTAAGATTQIAADSSLSVGGAFTQAATSTLDVALGSAQPVISAATADLGGTLNITGFGASAPTSASALIGTQTNVIHTTGGITNDFDSVTLGGASSPVDYLTLAGGKSANALDYNVGFGLTWLAGATQGNGVFTLANPVDTFNVDMALGNQAASATGWDGTTLTKNGAGTLLLSAVNTYTGQTLITAGTLQTGIANAFATSSAVNVASGATLDLNNFNQTANSLSGAGNVTLGSAVLTANNTADTTFGGALSGTGGLIKNGIAALTLTGDSAYTGGTTISAGTLQLGAGGTTGSIVGDVTNNGTLSFNRSNALTFDGSISGGGVVHQQGAGTVLLTGDSNAFSGTTLVDYGTLRVDGTLGSATSGLTVQLGGTIAGHGTIGGNVLVDNGVLAPGASPGTLTIGGELFLTSTAVLNYEFGEANAVGGALDDLTVVGGNLTLDGTLNVTAPTGGTFGPGLYRVISYGGTLTNNGLELGTLPAGSDAFVQTGFVGQVNLVNMAGLTLNYWDGTGPKFDGVINGGNGVWQAAAGNDNWTEATGTLNAPYTDGAFAIFAGTPGTVTVDNSLGAVSSSGMQFATSGYVVEGDPITLLAGANTIRVGDGTGAGSGYVATIGPALTGAGGVDKTDLGTLVLVGANSYTGGTTISQGTLQLGNGGTTGSIVGDVVDNGTLAFNRSDAVTFGGVISGSGSVHQMGTGTTILTAANAYSGGTTISAGTLQLGDGVATGSIVGDVVDNGALAFNNPGGTMFAGAISGTGQVIKSGAAALTLTADNTYTGTTTISAGTLQLGTGGTTGSIVGDVTNNGALIFNRSNNVTFSAAIDGTGSVSQIGGGTTTLTGANAYAGGTTISGGTLSVGADANLGAAAGGVALDGGTLETSASFTSGRAVTITPNNGSIQTDAGTTLTLTNTLSGASGALTKEGDGTLVLTSSNTYGGGTTISAGTLQIGTTTGLTGSIVGDVANNGTLALGHGNAWTFTGAISGTGNVNQIGLATTTLTADNTYTGGTTISAGTLQLGNGGTSGSIVGDVVDNGTLAFNRSDALTFAGTISGTGSLRQAGTGTTTLTADNTYAGGTTISAGTLQLGAGGTTGSIVGNVTNNGTLAFNRSNAMTYAGTISGGAVVQAGAGTTTLTGTGSSVSSVDVNAGTLDLAQAGAFNANAFTTASGATTHIAAESTLTVAGAFTQASGSTLAVDLGSTQPIVSAATANLGGTLDITGFGAAVPNTASALTSTHFNVIHTSGGITNDFSTVELGGAGGDLDFLTLAGSKSVDSLDYNVGFGLAWMAGATQSHGVFTLVSATETFDVDVPLGNQTPSSSGWDGTSLTKNGAGTLVLSAANTYTGATTINGGTLRAGIADAFATSSAVNVAAGATLALNGFNQLAHNLGGAGSVTLGSAALTVQSDSNTTFGGVISGAGSVTKEGAAALVLAGDSTYTGGTTINAGTLQIGDGGTAGGILGNITNNAALVINRSDSVQLPGPISGSGSLTKLGAGVASLAGANTYSGATNVNVGTLKAGVANAFSAASAHTVSSGATLDTGGFNQTVAALDNAGTVSLLSTTPGSTLAVAGAYVGRGGTLRLGTRLGDSASLSDRFVLDGPGASASGTTHLEITNVAGLGALTSGSGIEVVSARNGATTTAQTTKDAFVLAGGATIAGVAKGNTTLQAPHIDAGAYEYRLYAADAGGSGENWYLRSTSTIVPTPPPGPNPVIIPPPVEVPTYRAEVPMVAGLPAQFRQGDLAMLGNLHRRIGDENITQPQTASDASSATPRDRRAWGRAIYTDLDIQQEGTVNPQSSGYLGGLQAGTDLWSDSAWRAGVYVGYLEGGSDTSGNARATFGHVGRNDLQSRYLGGYATWTREDGLYADTVLQGGSHRYTLRPDFNPSVSGKASSLTASVEAGKPFKLSDSWSIEPQAQLVYQRSSFDDVQLSGATVRQDTDAGWIGRLGVRIKGDVATSAGRLQPYGRANLYYGGSGTDIARFISPGAVTDISSRTGYTSAELAAGMTLALNDKTSLYGELGRVFSVSGDARVRSSIQGSVGLRLSWK